MRILDLGCGDGNNKYHIYSSQHETSGVDIDEANIATCKKKFPQHQFILVDGETLPFEDNYFDMVHTLDVLEHVDDIDQVLRESTRVLKSGGKFIVEVPYWKSEEVLLKIKPSYWEQVHHVRMFRDDEMESLFSKFGYRLTSYKRIYFFIHIYLAFAFKRSDIVNQRGELNLSLWNKLLFILLYTPYYAIYFFGKSYFDNKFPKSIAFEFTKE